MFFLIFLIHKKKNIIFVIIFVYMDDQIQTIRLNTNDPWIEKYRPTQLIDIISQDFIINMLKKCITSRNVPHLLMYGPSGIGKTSTIIACANDLYKEKKYTMTLELNASDDRGINVVRSKIKEFILNKNVFYDDDNKNLFKLVILDEVDAMTNDAQASLRKIIEKYTLNARFCIICNSIQKINIALQSRCICLKFLLPKTNDVFFKLKNIAIAENVNITECGLMHIIKRSNGDIRKMINMLQSLTFSNKKITKIDVNIHFNYPQDEHVKLLIDSLINKSFVENYNIISNYINVLNISFMNILIDIHSILIDYILNNRECIFYNILNDLSDIDILHIFDNMRLIEINTHICSNDSIQICAFIGIFKCKSNKYNDLIC